MIIKDADYSSIKIGKVTQLVGKGMIIAEPSPSGGGTVAGGGIYNLNQQVQLTATATAGYEFSRWSDGDTSPTRTITVVSKRATYTAEFIASTYDDFDFSFANTVQGLIARTSSQDDLQTQVNTSNYNVFAIVPVEGYTSFILQGGTHHITSSGNIRYGYIYFTSDLLSFSATLTKSGLGVSPFSVFLMQANEEVNMAIPEGTKYLYVMLTFQPTSTNIDLTPTSLRLYR